MRHDRLAAARYAPLSYQEVGATTGQMPDGYRQFQRTCRLGTGLRAFNEAAGLLMSWEMHRRAGLKVDASAAHASTGAVVVLGLGLGRLRLHVPCRVVLVLEEPRRRGFAYGTLHGHPESGEELFEITRGEADEVRVTVTAFSRPATWWSYLGGPATRRIQDGITQRYLAGLRSVEPLGG